MPEHPLSAIQRLDPRMAAFLNQANDLAYSSGALPRKIKLLMAMAFDAAQGAELGVRALAGEAMKEGASREEVAETLRVAFHLSGVGALYTASAGLKDLV